MFKQSNNSSKSFQRLYVGLALAASTIFLVQLLASEPFQKNNAARYVASFIVGLFGYTAVETLRRSLD